MSAYSLCCQFPARNETLPLDRVIALCPENRRYEEAAVLASVSRTSVCGTLWHRREKEEAREEGGSSIDCTAVRRRRAAAGAAHLHPMTSQIISSDAAAAPSATAIVMGH